FSLPVICIMEPDSSCNAELRAKVLAGKACWEDDGSYINSSSESFTLNGMSKKEGITAITAWLEKKGIGKATVNYKIRDWLFSRQRYWGEPFPVIHWENGEITLDNESSLPVVLPEVADFRPGADGTSPLSNAGDWLNVVDSATGRKGRRETNTMPQWAGSCWYYLRYISPSDNSRFINEKAEKYWMPVDLYVGGAEHAVLHLLYSRFWHKVLFDLKLVSTDEPFQKLFNQGMILAFAYEDSVGSKVPSDEVEERDGRYFRKGSDAELKQIVAKMSKSLKNVVNPDDVVAEFGADTLRLYEMFMGPLEATKPWQTKGLDGQFRFLQRVWRAVIGDDSMAAEYTDEVPSKELLRLAHQTIIKVSSDIEAIKFNTAISQMMIFCNEILKQPKRYKVISQIMIKVLHPFAPHIAEEMWSIMGDGNSLTFVPWPEADLSIAVEDTIEVIVQVNGKLKAKFEVAKGSSADKLEALAKGDESVAAALAGKTVVKTIAVPDKLVNFVVR
ncbi:MAG: class I tRNA ligase family protein, partial [Fibrobacteres bacterium]|nr:class I tRNA ligase family protein [Fibrobacterota bacterium]